MHTPIKRYTRPILKQLRRTIGGNIKRIRTDQGFNIESFAQQAGIPVYHLAAYERGIQDVPLHVLVIMSYRLNVPVNALLDGV